jgi:demethylmenaquinone methyltransferase/2-methoxy-6-polyprenyl-1,4-benzoquinol methylase
MSSTSFYKCIAPLYGLFDILLLLGGSNPRKSLLHCIPDRSLSILDLCAGTASSAILVAKHSKSNSVVGIDMSEHMLKIGTDKIARTPVKNLHLQYMDATCTDFPDNRFDIIMVSFALHEMDTELLQKVLAEVNRLLKSDGLFLVLDFAKGDGLFSLIFTRIWSILEPPCFKPFIAMHWVDTLANNSLALSQTHTHPFVKLWCIRKTS